MHWYVCVFQLLQYPPTSSSLQYLVLSSYFCSPPSQLPTCCTEDELESIVWNTARKYGIERYVVGLKIYEKGLCCHENDMFVLCLISSKDWFNSLVDGKVRIKTMDRTTATIHHSHVMGLEKGECRSLPLSLCDGLSHKPKGPPMNFKAPIEIIESLQFFRTILETNQWPVTTTTIIFTIITIMRKTTNRPTPLCRQQ